MRHHSLWSIGTSYVDHSAQGLAEVLAQTESALDILLQGPTQAQCNQAFTVTVLVTNTSSLPTSDLSVVSAAPATVAERQPRCVCFQASSPLKELAPGEQTSLDVIVLPLRSGPLRIDNISIVSGAGKVFRPPLALIVAVGAPA